MPKDKFFTTEIERFILLNLNFEIEQLTLQTILETFLSHGVLFADDQVRNMDSQEIFFQADTDKTLALMEKYTEFFSLLCLQDIEILKLNNYFLAAAIIAASRAKCKLT